MLKKNSENDQLSGHFQSFFFHPPDPKSEKKVAKSTNKKKFWPKYCFNQGISLDMS